MSVLPALLFGALLLCVCLLAAVALRYAGLSAAATAEVERLSEELAQSQRDTEVQKLKVVATIQHGQREGRVHLDRLP